MKGYIISPVGNSVDSIRAVANKMLGLPNVKEVNFWRKNDTHMYNKAWLDKADFVVFFPTDNNFTFSKVTPLMQNELKRALALKIPIYFAYAPKYSSIITFYAADMLSDCSSIAGVPHTNTVLETFCKSYKSITTNPCSEIEITLIDNEAFQFVNNVYNPLLIALM